MHDNTYNCVLKNEISLTWISDNNIFISDGEFAFYIKIGEKGINVMSDIARKLCLSGKFQNAVIVDNKLEVVHKATKNLCYLDFRENATVRNLTKTQHILNQDQRSYNVMYLLKTLIYEKDINYSTDGVVDFFVLWLTVFFLQNNQILPRIMHYHKRGTFDLNTTYNSVNRADVEDVFLDLLEYYNEFDFGKIICPYNNETRIDEESKRSNVIRIIEPMENKLLVSSINFCKKFKKLCADTVQHYRAKAKIGGSKADLLKGLIKGYGLLCGADLPLSRQLSPENLTDSSTQVTVLTVVKFEILYCNCIYFFIKKESFTFISDEKKIDQCPKASKITSFFMAKIV